RRLAEQWEALHPEIQLEFLPKVSFSDYTTWLKTKMAGGMAPDIFWALWTQLDVGAYPAGCAVQLNDFFQKPNPYVEGNKQWKDLFFPAIYERTGGSSGRQWSVVGDYVGTSVYYNKSMFRAAGIDMDALQGSVTWSEYREICQKLSAAGFVPWSFAFGSDTICTNRTWLQRLILTNLYAEIWDEICFTNPIQPNVIDAYVAFRNGLIGPRSPRWMSMWPMIKEMVDHWM
ncbi:MAG: ABC transporter substrate-binding protein, partial [Clostridia bacterium]